MDDIKPDEPQLPHSEPQPAAPPAPAVESTSAASRGARRGLLGVLAVLYACSIAAAMVLLLRGGGPGGQDGKSFLPGARRLLAPSKEGVVGWVPIRGTISGSSSGRPWEKGAEQWAKRVLDLGDKKEVKAIVLDINSPGGSVGAVQEVYQAILRVRNEKKKPVVAVVGDIAASGGYYLAAACDKIVVHPGSLIGSIGVIFNRIEAEPLLKKIGITTEPIKSGKMKDIGSPARPMTKEEKEVLQAIIDDTYGQFLTAVAEGRKMPVDKVRPMADGRIFNGAQALSLGLVDQLGDSRDALLLAGKLGGIPGKPKIMRDSDSFSSVLELIDSRMSDWLRPEATLLRRMEQLSYGTLEYRWTGTLP
ncbi:MAG: signal peptide peptidase SppA [Elusimicrobia bacterium]|nr:signal peptide peptidase SppA [Elusimicrobiota bacterium]